MELYIHIPYCRQKCRYCDFASYPNRESTMSAYVDALLLEAEYMAQHAAGTALETAFIGGGTPSLLPPALLERMLNGLHDHFVFPDGMEFTTEANPGTLTEDWLHTAKAGGVNRLSLGLQASQPHLLRLLGRIHTLEDAITSVRMARQAGFDNISLDLMFGLPGQTPAMWRDTLHAALSLEPQHLSCYGLIPEEGTPLMRDLDAGRLVLPDEDDERQMYDDTLDTLARHGYLQYEISNFALPSCECRHNIGYWQQVPYIGLGASAASMLPDRQGERRLCNPAQINDYMDMVRDCRWTMRETTIVTRKEMQFETLMLGLRMTQGVSEKEFWALHGVSMADCFGAKLRALEEQGLLLHQEGRWQLTRRGMDVQNTVLVDLMDD